MIKTYFYSFIILCLLSLYISLTCNLKAPCMHIFIINIIHALPVSNPFGSSQDIFPSDSRINNNTDLFHPRYEHYVYLYTDTIGHLAVNHL